MPDAGARPRAAVDVGTNSVRLLVVAADGTRILREMTITRLGLGIDRRGRLDEVALTRTLGTIERYAATWRTHGVAASDVRIAATSAIRDAADRDRFFEGVRAAAGVDAEVLSGDEEARTAFRGATTALTVPPPAAVLDIGGGSTELIVGDVRGEVVGAYSMQLGSVRLTERLLPSDPPAATELDAAAAEVAARLDEADAALAQQGSAVSSAASLIGTAGTMTTLAALHLELPAYLEAEIHATRLPASAIRGWARRLAAMPAAERARLGPMQPGREDVVAAGSLIAATIVERYGFEAVHVSEADILDGLAADA